MFLYPHYRSPLRFLPDPNDGHFMLGQTLKFIRADSANDLPLNFMRRFLDAPLIRYTHIGGAEWILVNSVQAVRDIYQSKCYEFVKPSYFRRITGEIAGIGLVNAEGDIHRQERKLMNGKLANSRSRTSANLAEGAFKLANIKKLVPVFNAKASALSCSIGASLSSCDNEAIDVCDVFQKSTFGVISLATLGIESATLDTPQLPFSELYRRILDQEPAGITLSLINTFIPIRWIPLKANQDFLNANKEVRQLLRETIRSRISEIQRVGYGGQRKNIMQQFTEEGSQDLLSFMLYERGGGEDRWSEDEILGHVKILASIPHNAPPSYAELESLPYLAAFAKEVVRCFSPITFNARTPVKDTTVCDTVIPAGTTILITPQVLNSHPTIWGPDAERFDPDRHLPDDTRGELFPLSRDPFAMASFGNGPRICIGKAFGLLQMKSMLVELLRNFELQRENDVFGGVKVKNYMHLKPKGAIWVKFKPLSS
ncbi:cytochrome P450 [Lophiotrema nucula]|uniref:Cytochrome P450 n=1 Tax=Lophiotrema nucula TaxID=690887 RepID=A0A6A5ZQU3_9PLEO|nr:cytochrome P450 [Lophiotrema nucula]